MNLGPNNLPSGLGQSVCRCWVQQGLGAVQISHPRKNVFSFF